MKRVCIVMTALASLSAMVATAVGQSPHVAATTRSEWIKFNPVTPLTAATFANPPATDWPWVRLNLPAGADPAEIQAEVHQMHDAGIAGIEVGQGAFPNNDQLLALLTAATQAGIKVSLSHGPTQSPAGYSIDSDHARKTMYFGRAAVDAGATFDGPLPAGAQTVVGRGGFGGIGGRGGGVGSSARGGWWRPRRWRWRQRRSPSDPDDAHCRAGVSLSHDAMPCDRSCGTRSLFGRRFDTGPDGQEHGWRAWRDDRGFAPMDRAVLAGRRTVASHRVLDAGRLGTTRPVQPGRLPGAGPKHGDGVESGSQSVDESQPRRSLLRFSLERSRQPRRTVDQSDG